MIHSGGKEDFRLLPHEIEMPLSLLESQRTTDYCSRKGAKSIRISRTKRGLDLAQVLTPRYSQDRAGLERIYEVA